MAKRNKNTKGNGSYGKFRRGRVKYKGYGSLDELQVKEKEARYNAPPKEHKTHADNRKKLEALGLIKRNN